MNDEIKSGWFQRMHQKLKSLKIYYLITGLFFLFLLFYLVFAILAPLKTLEKINSEFNPEPKEDWALANFNPKTDSILKATAIVNSKLLLTEFDSICFSLNLNDSTINLVMQGVTIHSSKISDFKMSKIFSKTDKGNFLKYLSTPFIVQYYKSSIVKVPIVVKDAPKDTVEANKINSIPQLPPEKYVRVVFWFDKYLKIIIEQKEKPAGKEKIKAIINKTVDKLQYFKNITKGTFTFKIPEYQPWIKIQIPGDEAKTIFRALPENAALAMDI